MKKKFIFTFACVVAFIAGIVSCTNDDFEECVPVAEMQKNAITRSVGGGMTKEEVQARLDEIGEKYGVYVKLLYATDYSIYDETKFERIEQSIVSNIDDRGNYIVKSSESNGVRPVDDCTIDEFGIATLNANMESNDNKKFSVNINVNYKVPAEYTEDSTIVIAYQKDLYSYRYDVDIRKYNGSINIEPTLVTLDGNAESKKSSCSIGDFRHTLINYGSNDISFEFVIDVFLEHLRFFGSVAHEIRDHAYIKGDYYNGMLDMYAISSNYNIVIGL